MTTPSQAKKSNYGPRMYAWPPQPPHEFEVVSVTSAISGGLPKPFLIPWAAKITAEDALRKHDIIGALIEAGDVKAAVDLLKGARFRDMGSKADRGTIVHAALETYLAGGKVDSDTIHAQLDEAFVPKSMWKSATLMVSGLMEFLFDEEPEVYWSESTVYSRAHGYAGTADLIAKMRVGDSLVPVVIDVKTSKRIYDETALQLCAYARADFVGLDDGTEAPLVFADRNETDNEYVESGEEIEYGVVVRPTPTGGYEKVVFALTDEVFELFLSCLSVATKQGVLRGARRP